jgi:hypothetical protein
MTVAGTFDDATVPMARPSVRFEVARLEARRHLRNPVLWLGVAASLYSAWRSRSIDWNGGAYSAFPVDLVLAAWAVFVLGVVSGGRDHQPGQQAPPSLAVPTHDGRIAAGRLLGLLAPVAVVAAAVATIVTINRLTGGFTIGEMARRTDDAQHSLPEIAQPILLAAMCGAAGVAAGRAVRHTAVALAGGTVLLLAFGLISWAWQWTPAVYVAPVQLQPFYVDLPGGDPSEVPAGSWLSSPGPHQDGWRRLVVEPVVAAGHDLVLLGGTALFVGWAVRRHAGRIAAGIGVAMVGVGVAIQMAAAPW